MTGQDALTGADAEANGDAGAGGTLGEFASEALGQAISQRGGFGIASHIVKELSRSSHISNKRNAADGRHEKSTIRTPE